MGLRDKRVLVTGADGFIGSHLVEQLVREGCKVRALSCYNSFNNWGWLEDIACKEDVEVVAGDVRDQQCCRHITKGSDVVFHLAALIAIPYSYTAPESYIDTNVKGTLHMCQAALENGVGRVIQVSTSEVYGSARYVPIDEKHPLQPQSPYSASKIGADAVAMSFFHSFDLQVAVARPFNTYGPRQSARAVIPTIITQMAAGRKEIKLGDVTPTRDMNYVTDTCRGLIAIADNEAAAGEVVNIGSNYEISIRDLAETIRQLMGSDADFVFDEQRVRPPVSEVQRLWCDNAKIRSLTGFEPRHSIEEGLRRTIEWFSDPENLKRYKTDIYNV
ncbi:MAG: SDR family NAD(P)-dependent oxidoreductase [Nitrospirae bacterium]|nr:SDR family NAD(P)-dependent oxidoreductase [Nitrospirota bacterium]